MSAVAPYRPLPSAGQLLGHVAADAVVSCARAPLRISFCGGGTDLQPYASEHGGLVLSATICRYAYATLRPLPEPVIRVRSMDYDRTATYDIDELDRFDGNLDLIRGCINRLHVDASGLHRGLELFLETDAPPGSGLGGSSALVVAVIGAFGRWRHLNLDPYEIAGLAYEVERKDVGIPGGMQDQYAAAFGGFNLIEFFGEHEVVVNPLRVPDRIVRDLEYNSLLVFSGATRPSAGIIERQVESAKSRRVQDALRRMKELALEAKAALLHGRLRDLGVILHDEWLNKRSTSAGISNRRLDLLYETARKNGAIGGKVSGAGGGGFMFLLCPFEAKHRVAASVGALGADVFPVAFAPEGMESWRTSALTGAVL